MTEIFPQDAWYAVGATATLAPGDVMPVHIFGEERVAWRGEDGICRIWQNRCVHRGMRLQYGFVDGDRLACRYHGWRFGGDGKCVRIPAHPDMTPPDDYCVPSFPSAETGGLIWTSRGTPSEPPRAPGDGEDTVFCRTVTVLAPPAAADEYLRGHGAKPVSPGLFTTAGTPADGDIDLTVALQPADAEKTQLHVSVPVKGTGSDTAGLRLRGARLARQLRDRIEAEGRKDAA